MFTSQLFVGPMVMIAVWLPIIVYILVRVRDSREQAPDIHVGIKVIACWFQLAAVQILLLGTVILFYSIIESSEEWRIGAGLMVPALVIYGVLHLSLSATNTVERPNARRMFCGINLAYTGVIAFIGLIVGSVALFQPGPSFANSSATVAVVLVYTLAAGVQGSRLLREARG
ncbi:MAG: hypothetical protein JKY56_04660 [Kofleriaceae bacterium]|nr:hypothetical protein [Kofleriaceae bacterium]